ncbi:MAG: hypothetical protein Q4F95_03265 [Oscillospiraceae bacterium]|nr:hypothetical protein [Oscillospiraceae bacterium]
MKLFFIECKRSALNIIYLLFIILLTANWYTNFADVTDSEIKRTASDESASVSINRPLLLKPEPDDPGFGSKTEENPEKIMTGAAEKLITEYKKNIYAAYPFGYYKTVSLSETSQMRVLEIIKEITGLDESQLNDLPDNFFPTVNGTIIHFSQSDNLQTGSSEFKVDSSVSDGIDQPDTDDHTKKFISQVSYEHFKELMSEMEDMIGLKGSNYSMKMLITYCGQTEMTYEDACEEYRQTCENDKVTGGFARLMCDYMGQVIGLLPVIITVFIWLRDKRHNTDMLIYCRKISSFKLIFTRISANTAVVLLPVFLLSFQSLIPLVKFAAENNLSADYSAFIKYILWWLLPETLIVITTGTFLTLLTDSPVAVLVQFIWWFAARGMTDLSDDTSLLTLMIRHNTLSGYEIIQQNAGLITLNRLLFVMLSMVLTACSVLVLNKKRNGRLNASGMYKTLFATVREKIRA